jgi:hypothetical protein
MQGCTHARARHCRSNVVRIHSPQDSVRRAMMCRGVGACSRTSSARLQEDRRRGDGRVHTRRTSHTPPGISTHTCTAHAPHAHEHDDATGGCGTLVRACASASSRPMRAPHRRTRGARPPCARIRARRPNEVGAQLTFPPLLLLLFVFRRTRRRRSRGLSADCVAPPSSSVALRRHSTRTRRGRTDE